ncbi:polycystin-1-like protein 2 [Mixophyes fleayi]|uniref:polycystin-1-like protein 2 n=1 Tax=Mixophyes fleayi TaxID=3061075 RepID=UPI003F4E413E
MKADIFLPGDIGLETPCLVLTHSAVIQKIPCLQQNGFICQTEGQSCNTERLQQSITSTAEKRVKSQIFARRTKRSVNSSAKVPDLLNMALQFVNTPTMGGNNLTDLLTRINSMMQEEEETSKTDLQNAVSLLNQLSLRLQFPDISSSSFFGNLSNVVYYGINSVFQSVLSSCSEIVWTPQEKQTMVDSALGILDNLEGAMLANLSEKVTLQTPMFSIYLNSVNTSEIGQQVLTFPIPVAEVVFPSHSALQPVVQSLSSVQIQMMSFQENPFTLNSSFNISGTVAGLTLLTGKQELSVHNLSDNFQIFLPQSSANTPSSIHTSSDQALKLSLVVAPTGSTLVIIVVANKGVHLDLYHGLTCVPKAQLAKQSVQDSHTWILSTGMFPDPTAEQKFLVSPTNTSGIQDLQLDVSVFTVDCAFWDPGLQTWRSDGCMVGPQTTLSKVQCLCNHLSFFGSSFLVLPVQIDVTRTAEYFSQISENPVIVVLVACFYFCYILALLWARRQDLRDHLQSRIIVPRDNDPCGLYRYLVTVGTGHRRGAGTSAKVCLSLSGLEGQFGPILLSDTRHEVFRKGNVDIFILSVPFPLGAVKSITLNHDGTGPHKSWYIAQVTVQDVQLKRSWHFLCNTWLSQPPRGDSLSKTFISPDDQELKSFRSIFLKRTLRGLRDEHIWISVLNHPARSVFTRVQKVSCCMCLLLCTIVINLMFWELPQATYPVLISMGSVILTWKDIMIAFESAILMFPVNLLIIYIFRNTRPKESGASGTKTKKDKQILNAKKSPTRPLNIATVLEDLSGLVRTLSQTSRNNLEVSLNQESNENFTILLQTISHLLHKQLTPGPMSISVPLAQLSSDELHALFCAHYVSRKLRKVLHDLQQLESQQLPEKQQYDEFIALLQPLLQVLEKSVPALPAKRPLQKQQVKRKRLPWWFLLIGWSLLISISVVSTYFTMMYGFLYGKQSSIRWIISMALSLFQSIFILQPLKVVGFAVFFALVLKKADEDEEDLLDGELGPSDEYQTCDETTL